MEVHVGRERWGGGGHQGCQMAVITATATDFLVQKIIFLHQKLNFLVQKLNLSVNT